MSFEKRPPCVDFVKNYSISPKFVQCTHIWNLQISNRSSEENDHATHVDLNVAATLLQKVGGDGSPLVRKELIVALHWLVLDFEKQFVTIATEMHAEELHRQIQIEDAAAVSGVNHKRQNSLASSELKIPKSTSSAALLQRSNSLRGFQGLPPVVGTPPNSTNITSSPAMMSPLISTGLIRSLAVPTSPEQKWLQKVNRHQTVQAGSLFGNVYTTLWKMFLSFMDDPFVEVADLSRIVVEHVKQKALKALRRTVSKSVSTANLKSQEPLIIISEAKEPKFTTPKPVKVQSESTKAKFFVGSPASDHAGRPREDSEASASNFNPETPPDSSPEGGTDATDSAALTTKRTPISKTSTGSGSLVISPYSAHFTASRKLFSKGPQLTPPNLQNGHTTESTTMGSPGAERRQCLISTKFVEWSSKTFAEPILNKLDQCANYSSSIQSVKIPAEGWIVDSFSDTVARFTDDVKLIFSQQFRFDTQLSIAKSSIIPSSSAFVPFMPLLVIGNSKGEIQFWNWEAGHMSAHMDNNHSDDSELRTLDIINPLTHSYLMTGTNTGDVKVWATNFGDEIDVLQTKGSIRYKPKLITAWQTLYDQQRMFADPWTVLRWEQETTTLLAAGDVKIVRIWDAVRETHAQDLPLGAETAVTSLSINSSGQHFIAAGCLDGSIRLFDRRMPQSHCHVMTMREREFNAAGDRNWIVGVHLEQGMRPICGGSAPSKLIAASKDGQIRIWEPRMFNEPVKKLRIDQGNLIVMDAHPNCNLLALGSTAHTVQLMDYEGHKRGLIQYHEGFLGQKLGDVRALKFHPYRINLSLGTADSVISVYGLDRSK